MSELIEVKQHLLVPNTHAGCCKVVWKRLCGCFCFMPKKSVQLGHDKSRWVKFRDWARRKNKLKPETVYPTLLELYAHEDVFEKLVNLQLEPNFEEEHRDDLEFYIPQLMNFLLYGEYRLLEDLLKYVLEACRSSFSFSHRVLWFLRSTDFNNLTSTGVDFNQLYKSVQIVSRGSHVVYLNPALSLGNLITNLGAESMFDVNKEREKRELIKPTLTAYAASEKEHSFSHYLDALSIPLQPFRGSEDGYLSTIYFVKALTDIAVDLLSLPNKLESLKLRLSEVNSSLPSGAYLPFSKKDLRECAVLWLRVSESKVFATKERAPYLVYIEVFNPAEELEQIEVDELESSAQTFRLTSSFGCPSPKISPRLHTQTLTDRDLENILHEANDQLIVEREHPEQEKNPMHRSFGEGGLKSQMGENAGATLCSIDLYANKQKEELSSQRQPDSETFRELAQKIRKHSPFGMLKTWRLVSVIVKAGDDLRQEQLAMQLISLFDQIFKEAKLRLWLRPYDILATETDCGLIECVSDALSIDSIKKSLPPGMTSLRDYFVMQFGAENSKPYKAARKAFLQSLAGYSLVCYMLQIKDRHNGNILLDRQGHIVHIDFGFMLSNSPGDMNFESAPFKLSQDFVEVMGGARSTAFVEFRGLVVKGFKALRRQSNKIILLLEMLRTGVGSSLPCFSAGEETVIALKARLNPRPKMTGVDCATYINSLIDESLLNWRTKWYDRYQYWCQNIF